MIQREEIKTIVKTALTFAGASSKNIPQGEVKEAVLYSIWLTLKNHTNKDVTEALTLAAQCELEFDLRLYDKLISAEWFGRLMFLYKDYQRRRPKPIPKQLNEHQPTEEENRQASARLYRMDVELYKSTGQVMNLGNITYSFCKDKIHITKGNLLILRDRALQRVKMDDRRNSKVYLYLEWRKEILKFHFNELYNARTPGSCPEK